MAYQTRKDPLIIGMVVGVAFALLMRVRLLRAAFLFLVAYLCCIPLYDYIFTQAEAAPSEYSMRVAAEDVPTLAFSRDNPQWSVTVQMTNKGKIKIRKWTLHGKLYDCPRAFAPIDTCRFIVDQGTWVTDSVRPGETMTSTERMTFWPGQETHGQLRVLWTVGEVITDTDTDQDEAVDRNRAALAAYAAHGAPRK